MYIPRGDLAPRRRPHRRRWPAVLAVLLVLAVAAGALAVVRWRDRDDALAEACTSPPGATIGPDAVATGGPMAGAAALPRPGAFRTRVLNGTGRDGLAATTAARLVDRGFRVTGTSNGAAAPRTLVLYGAGGASAARVLAAHTRAAARLDRRVRGEVVLVIGADFRRLATAAEVRRATAPAVTSASLTPKPCER